MLLAQFGRQEIPDVHTALPRHSPIGMLLIMERSLETRRLHPAGVGFE
jgi:hypothetical protein